MKARQIGAFLFACALVGVATADQRKLTPKPKPTTYKLQAAAKLFAGDSLTCLANNAAALKAAHDAWKAIPNLEFSQNADGSMTGWYWHADTACKDACESNKAAIDAILRKCNITSCSRLAVSCMPLIG